MIFLRYESFRQYLRLYPVTALLLAANIVMFGIELANGGPGDVMTLLRLGAITNVPEYDQLWRYVAALFLHGSWEHIVFNLFALFVFAPPLERIFGHWRYGLFYLASGVLGNAAAVFLARGEWIGVGASSAIYGIYGAYLFITLFQRHMLDAGSRTTVYGILAVGLITSFLIPHIGYWAHIGGLAAGFLLYGAMGRRNLNR
ncbi:rhomboid family intramembrane serine protease [Cohnella nanjingensis]|uniref:Rhomboid family intramembrane serine protease n=1 Tax=Cohnella nanjingensis TaxID=1387779 RepID=A0A7X0RV76_9BACL|nr:rhomboid family intramembrane serine protease [Cohnella nanjingensis]MBB6674312.1 rhomboid family intramembrane serine protease [Cohnella nanjingensis]